METAPELFFYPTTSRLHPQDDTLQFVWQKHVFKTKLVIIAEALCFKQRFECFSPCNLNIFIKLCCAPGLTINHSSFQALLINTQGQGPSGGP